MAEASDFFTESASHQDGSTSDQHQPPQSFDSLSFQDNVFEDADFWPLHEDFFDISGFPRVLPISDTPPSLKSPEAIEQSYDPLEDLALHVQDTTLPAEPESVGWNALSNVEQV